MSKYVSYTLLARKPTSGIPQLEMVDLNSAEGRARHGELLRKDYHPAGEIEIEDGFSIGDITQALGSEYITKCNEFTSWMRVIGNAILEGLPPEK